MGRRLAAGEAGRSPAGGPGAGSDNSIAGPGPGTGWNHTARARSGRGLRASL
jgi:hypothetical protein